jgi:hypothetical protein
MTTRLLALLIAISALFAAGCASIPMADQAADKAAKAFTAPPGKSRIYVYRNESFGAAITMDVFIDGRKLGQTVARTYLVADVDPGPHKIMGKSENEHLVDLTTVAGRVYFIWQEVKMGLLYARNLLQVVDDKAGQAGVLESNLAAESK